MSIKSQVRKSQGSTIKVLSIKALSKAEKCPVKIFNPEGSSLSPEQLPSLARRREERYDFFNNLLKGLYCLFSS
jgi:hypothetical protein